MKRLKDEVAYQTAFLCVWFLKGVVRSEYVSVKKCGEYGRPEKETRDSGNKMMVNGELDNKQTEPKSKDGGALLMFKS